MNLRFATILALTAALMFSFFNKRVRAQEPLHAQVLVFLPAYEGSKLYDPALAGKGEEPPCVWGSVDAIRNSDLYLSLRMPNPLTAGPMLTAGPIDIYGRFVDGLTDKQDVPGFHPYTLDADFFIFSYDWRQEIATVLAPTLGQALLKYAAIHEKKTGIPAAQTQFILVGHSMGALIARTFVSASPQFADRIAGLYLVGPPNLGSVKAIKTLIVGPGGLKENVTTFPASLLNFLPNNVDPNVTKLTAISRASLYELLPFEDPHWEVVTPDGARNRVSAQDVLTIGPWERYWPSASLEKTVFLDGWLKRRQAETGKAVHAIDWQFCQDPDLRGLQKILAEVRDWRLKMGSLNYTNTLMTRAGEASRMKVIVGTGLKTPTGIITEGSHDNSQARYTYESDSEGDETVTSASALDDLHPTAGNVKLLPNVPHGKLMTDRAFLDYLYKELSRQIMVLKPEEEGPSIGVTPPVPVGKKKGKVSGTVP